MLDGGYTGLDGRAGTIKGLGVHGDALAASTLEEGQRSAHGGDYCRPGD